MSELKEKISLDIKSAMKAREQQKVTTLRGLMAAIKQYEVDTREEVDDAKIIQIIQKEVKMRRDAIGFAKDQSREELVQQNENEILMIQAYLGEQLSEEELESLIKELNAQGMTSMGQIMGSLNATHKGKFEGKTASDIAKRILNS